MKKRQFRPIQKVFDKEVTFILGGRKFTLIS